MCTSRTTRSLLVTVSGVLLAGNVQTFGNSPPQCVHHQWHEYNGHCYALTVWTGSWSNAEAEADSFGGGHLVTVNDPNENQWLFDTFQPGDGSGNDIWIGLYQDLSDPNYSEPDGGWKWSSGKNTTFLGWYGQEPDNQGGNQHWAVIEPVLSPSGQWDDREQTNLLGIIEVADECRSLGDMNCDGSLNGLDIDPFVLALTSTPPDFPEYYAEYPDCKACLADCDLDGEINGLDIDPFVDLLTGG